jgi:hypothetical protein
MSRSPGSFRRSGAAAFFDQGIDLCFVDAMMVLRMRCRTHRQEAPRFVEDRVSEDYDLDEHGRSWGLIRANFLHAVLAVIPMNDMLSLTSQQQEILLRGLRYVRSSVALECAEYSPEVDAERKRQYAVISELESLFQRGRALEPAAR